MNSTHISTGSQLLNQITGGFPRGAITEIVGPSGSGKTILALTCLREAERSSILVDSEFGVGSWIQRLGIDMKKIGILRASEPDIIMETLREIENPSIFIIDSLSSINIEARKLPPFLVSVLSILGPDTAVVCTNQIRSARSGTVSYGGRAVLFHPAMRVYLRRVSTSNTGFVVEAKVEKAYSVPHNSVRITIFKGRGVWRAHETLTQLLLDGTVTRRGAWYYYRERCLGEGVVSAAEALEKLPIYNIGEENVCNIGSTPSRMA